jgi:hypothetical protein
MSKTIDQVYRERNMYATAVAIMAGSLGRFDSGYYRDQNDWPVVWLQDGDDQAGVHVHTQLWPLLEASPLENRGPPGGYDGHSRKDRLNYLMGLIESGVTETQSSD